MEIIAHRGASHDAPENTLAAFRFGWEQKADAVELDVRLSKDGNLVVIHDDNTRRTAQVDKSVGEQTLAELRSLDVGRWKGKQWVGERILTLNEALATVPEGKRLFVELKCGPEGIPELVHVAGTSFRRPSPLVAIGFSRQTFYTVLDAFEEWGVFGLADEQRGRRGPVKLTAADVALIETLAGDDPGLSGRAIAERLFEERGVAVHRRTIERLVARAGKKNG